MADGASVREIFSRPISLLTSQNVAQSPYTSNLKTILDDLGLRSAEAQNLKHPITGYGKLLESDHKIYLAVDFDADDGEGEVVGFIKMGEKKLFVTDGSEPAWPANVKCILDFYICTKYQRHGWGRHLFNHAIQHEDAEPSYMAYDRPSEKLINFLAKHYRLTDVVEQPNRYVMYKDYFADFMPKYIRGGCAQNSRFRSPNAGFISRRY